MADEKNGAASEASETDHYAQKLSLFNPMREPVVRSAIEALQLPTGSWGLDAGCGTGQPSLWLAEAVGPAGQVTGLDLCGEFLDRARQTAQKYGLSERVSFQQGDVNKLPFDDDAFDWAWSMDCVGYHPQEALPPLKDLVRVVKPGGKVVILAWSSQQLLCGYPLLEARLNATAAGIAPFVKGMNPERHFLQGLGWLGKAGLTEPAVRTFVGDVQAPVSKQDRTALTALFQMRWGKAQSEVSPEDWAEFQRLCQPESADFILNLPDYYAFFTYSMFCGKVI